MNGYEQLIAAADEHRREGRFKEASIEYGRALTVGGPRDSYCRHLRGVCSRLVAEQRLDKASGNPSDQRRYLDQAARWLAKSEAYLESSLEEATPEQRARIRLDQAHTEESVARFLRLCGGNPERRLSCAREYREEAAALLG